MVPVWLSPPVGTWVVALSVAALSAVIGSEIAFKQQPIEQVRGMSEDLAIMYEWFESTGYDADIAALKKDYASVEWLSFADWAKAVDWKSVLA